MNATNIQRIFRGYWCRRKQKGQQLCDRISDLYIEMDETMSNYNGISRILEDLRFVEREVQTHGPFSAYGVQVPSSIPEWLVTISENEYCDSVQNIVWLTGILIPAYKERAEKRVKLIYFYIIISAFFYLLLSFIVMVTTLLTWLVKR